MSYASSSPKWKLRANFCVPEHSNLNGETEAGPDNGCISSDSHVSSGAKSGIALSSVF